MAEDWSEQLVVLRSGERVPFGRVLSYWSSHVDRLRRESLQPEARDSWGFFDLVAALHLRDAVERGLCAADEPGRDAAAADVLRADEDFKGFTVLDVDGLVLVAAAAGAREGWWWRRIPEKGPVVTDLNRFLQGH